MANYSDYNQQQYNNQKAYLDNLSKTGTAGQVAWAQSEMSKLNSQYGGNKNTSGTTGTNQAASSNKTPASSNNVASSVSSSGNKNTGNSGGTNYSGYTQAQYDNQKTYLESLIKQGGGNASWAQQELNNLNSQYGGNNNAGNIQNSNVNNNANTKDYLTGNNNLIYALEQANKANGGNSYDVGSYVVSLYNRVGSKRADGSVVTLADVDKELDRLGLSDYNSQNAIYTVGGTLLPGNELVKFHDDNGQTSNSQDSKWASYGGMDYLISGDSANYAQYVNGKTDNMNNLSYIFGDMSNNPYAKDDADFLAQYNQMKNELTGSTNTPAGGNSGFDSLFDQLNDSWNNYYDTQVKNANNNANQAQNSIQNSLMSSYDNILGQVNNSWDAWNDAANNVNNTVNNVVDSVGSYVNNLWGMLQNALNLNKQQSQSAPVTNAPVPETPALSEPVVVTPETESLLARLRGYLDSGLAVNQNNVAQQRAFAEQQAQEQANDAYVNRILQGDAMSEYLSALGMGTSGAALAAQMGIQGDYGRNLANINESLANTQNTLAQQEAQYLSDYNQNLANYDYQVTTDEANRAMQNAQLELQKQQSLYDQMMSLQQLELQQNQMQWQQAQTEQQNSYNKWYDQQQLAMQLQQMQNSQDQWNWQTSQSEQQTAYDQWLQKQQLALQLQQMQWQQEQANKQYAWEQQQYNNNQQQATQQYADSLLQYKNETDYAKKQDTAAYWAQLYNAGQISALQYKMKLQELGLIV